MMTIYEIYSKEDLSGGKPAPPFMVFRENREIEVLRQDDEILVNIPRIVSEARGFSIRINLNKRAFDNAYTYEGEG